MIDHGKPDNTGRGSGRIAGRRGALVKAPTNDPWIWRTAEMLASPVYQALSVNARKVLDALTVEHIRHGRQHNGRLMALYNDLIALPYRVTRRLIRSALSELEAGGFVEIARQGKMLNGRRQPTLYRLTMYACLQDNLSATNDWRRKSPGDVVRARRKGPRRQTRPSAAIGNVFPMRQKQKPS